MLILNSKDDADRAERILSLDSLISHYKNNIHPTTNSVTILAFNIFTDDQIDTICNAANFPQELKHVAQDTKALRSFIKGLSTEQLNAIAEYKYSPKAFSKLLKDPQNKTPASEECKRYFQNSHGKSALEILIEQELMTRG